MKFKYEHDHAGCLPCPPADATEPSEAINAFRLVSGTEMVADDFLPPARETIPRGFPSKPRKCTDFALSFFTTPKKLVKRYKCLKKNPNWSRHHIAATTIQPGDGYKTPPGDSGHFDLHESAAAQLHKQSTYLKPC
jgi:hypothetical protein